MVAERCKIGHLSKFNFVDININLTFVIVQWSKFDASLFIFYL